MGPYRYDTDFGTCCKLIPYMALKNRDDWGTDEKIYFDLKADALNGESNGVDIVLDAEQFNYADHQSDAVGFKIALHSHLDKPMIHFSSQLIRPGSETQIDLQPKIIETSKEAISGFSPKDRQCYDEGEQNLTYLTYKDAYRYEMNNCLIDQGIRDIIWNCRCLPNFGFYEEFWEFIPICSGEKLFCANEKTKSMGMRKIPNEYNDLISEVDGNSNMIGNTSKPNPIECMPSCKAQHNYIQMSSSLYPHRSKFFYQKTFCYVASHILQVTCQNEYREYFMRKDQPLLCLI